MKTPSSYAARGFCVALALTVLFAAGACSSGKPAQPNLLIIVSDALRADVLGCYGGPAHTPNIDRLAASGTRVDRCYSTTPWTWPSAVSMFTGNYPTVYHQTVQKLFPERRPEAVPVTVCYVPEEEQLLGEALAAEGYELRMALQNQLPRKSNSLQGFTPLAPAPRPGALQALLHYLGNRSTAMPFCLLAWVLDPHGEYDPPKRFRPIRSERQEPLPRDHHYYAGLNSRQLKAQTVELNPREREYIEALYRAEVEFVDRRVGAILTVLEERGLRETTLVVFTSDHGEAFWEHGYPSHGNTYFEEMVRVPLIFSGPGIDPGRLMETPVSHLDLAPTLASLLGVKLPGPVQGQSYAGFFSGKRINPAPLYFSGAHPQLQQDAIIDGRHKLISGSDGARSLFDLAADPEERQDLAVAQPGVADRLEAQLLAIREENRRLRDGRPPVDGASGRQDAGDLLEQMKALGYVE